MRLIAAAAAAATLLLIGSMLPVAHSEGVRDAAPVLIASDAVCPDASQSVGHYIHNTMVHFPDAVFKRFEGEQAQAGIAIFNKLPPEGNDTGDTFYIAFNPQSADAWLAIAKGDCIVSNLMVPRKLGAMIYMNLQKGLPGA